MPRFFTWGLPVGALLTFGVFFSIQRNAQRCPPLKISEESLDFGTVWAQRDFSWTVDVENMTSREIRITSIVGSCRCAGLDVQSYVVPARQSRHVPITLDLLPPTREDASMARREVAFSFAFQIEDGGWAVTPWTLRGAVRNAIDFVPDVHFGEVPVGTAPASVWSVSIEPLGPVTDIILSRGSPHLRTRMVAPSSAGAPYTLEIRLASGIPVGKHAFELGLRPAIGNTARVADSDLLPELPLRVGLTITTDVYVSPDRIIFGALPIGEPSHATVVLGSRGGQPFEVVGVSPAADMGIVVRRAPPLDGAKVFDVRVTPLSSGSNSAAITFLVRHHRDQPAYPMRVPVVWHGLID